MLTKSTFILATPPADFVTASSYQVPLAHMAYRVGCGPHLYRVHLPTASSGGYMMIDDFQFDGQGDPRNCCQQILRECVSRKFKGVICDFHYSQTPLSELVDLLAQQLYRNSIPLFLPEEYAPFSRYAYILIPTALSGGTLKDRIVEAQAQYGTSRVCLSITRSAEDFFLPSPSGRGVVLTYEQLQQKIDVLHPSIFFSQELCAHYFTYMNQSGGHFVLFDNANSIRQKYRMAQELHVPFALLSYPELQDLLPSILA